MLVLPTTFQLQRGIFLAGLCLIALIAAPKYWRCNREIVIIWMSTLVAGLFFVTEGVINNAPGAIRVTTVYLVWPCVYILFIGLVHNPSHIKLLIKTLIAGILVTSLLNIFLLVGALLGHIAEVASILQFQGAGIGLYNGYIELTSYNLTTVIYGLPFLLALLFVQGNNYRIVSSKILVTVLLFDLLVCLVSGRRVFWLLALTSPFLVFSILFISQTRLRFRYWLAVGGIVVLLLFCAVGSGKISFHIIENQFFSAFDFTGEASASLRYAQFIDLIQSWSTHPLLGHGFGASTGNVIRSEEMTWAYELSYVALLFHSGLLGMVVYSVAVLWIFYSGVNLIRKNPSSGVLLLPLLCGLAGFLMINATNPYLGKFDYLWTVFLPVAVINTYKTSICK